MLDYYIVGVNLFQLEFVESSLPPLSGVFFLFVFVYEDKKCRSISDFNLITLSLPYNWLRGQRLLQIDFHKCCVFLFWDWSLVSSQ